MSEKSSSNLVQFNSLDVFAIVDALDFVEQIVGDGIFVRVLIQIVCHSLAERFFADKVGQHTDDRCTFAVRN